MPRRAHCRRAAHHSRDAGHLTGDLVAVLLLAATVDPRLAELLRLLAEVGL